MSTAVNTARGTLDINFDSFTLLLHVMQSDECKKRDQTLSYLLDVKEFLLYVCSCRNVAILWADQRDDC